MMTRRRRPALWAWLLACMVVAQGLGLIHAVVHGAHARCAPAAWGMAQPWQADIGGNGWLKQFFSEHGHASECRLYDQSSHGDSMPAIASAAIPPSAVPDPVQVFEAAVPALATAFARARGPPTFG